MGCSTCGGAPVGYAHVWQLRQTGREVRQFASQHEAERAKAADGGRGVIIKATVKR